MRIYTYECPCSNCAIEKIIGTRVFANDDLVKGRCVRQDVRLGWLEKVMISD